MLKGGVEWSKAEAHRPPRFTSDSEYSVHISAGNNFLMFKRTYSISPNAVRIELVGVLRCGLGNIIEVCHTNQK